MSRLLSASTDDENDHIPDPDFSVSESMSIDGVDFDEEEIEKQAEIQAEEESQSVASRKPMLDRLRNAVDLENVARELFLKTQSEYWKNLHITITDKHPNYQDTYWLSLTALLIMSEIQSRHEQWVSEVEEIRAAKFEEELAVSKAEKEALNEERMALKEERTAIKEERAALAQEKSELKQDFVVLKNEMTKDLTKIVVTLAAALEKHTQKLQDQTSGAADRISKKFEEEITASFDRVTNKFQQRMPTDTVPKSLLDKLIGKRNGN